MFTVTRYEIAATHIVSGKQFLVAYTPRLSRPGLRDALRKRGEELIAALGFTDDDKVTWFSKPRPHCQIGHRWDFGFTGRTQVECRRLPLIDVSHVKDGLSYVLATGLAGTASTHPQQPRNAI